MNTSDQNSGKLKRDFLRQIFKTKSLNAARLFQLTILFVFLSLFSINISAQTTVGTELTEVKIEVRKEIEKNDDSANNSSDKASGKKNKESKKSSKKNPLNSAAYDTLPISENHAEHSKT